MALGVSVATECPQTIFVFVCGCRRDKREGAGLCDKAPNSSVESVRQPLQTYSAAVHIFNVMRSFLENIVRRKITNTLFLILKFHIIKMLKRKG